MTKNREWWANVQMYGVGRTRGTFVGSQFKTRYAAEVAASLAFLEPAFRIHVRLKPEGAPKRYASERERYLWEHPLKLRGVAP